MALGSASQSGKRSEKILWSPLSPWVYQVDLSILASANLLQQKLLLYRHCI